MAIYSVYHDVHAYMYYVGNNSRETQVSEWVREDVSEWVGEVCE